MRYTQTKKAVFAGEYRTKNGLRHHTDYIVTDSEVLAKEYVNRQLDVWGAELVSFKRVSGSEARQGENSSIVEI